MDVHKDTVAVVVAESESGEVRYFGEIGTVPETLQKRVSHVRKGSASTSGGGGFLSALAT